MSIDTTSPPRWTSAAIRKALLLPKPEGEVDKVLDFNRGGEILDLTPLERRALREIVDNADLLEIVTPDQSGFLTDDGCWCHRGCLSS